MIEDWQAGGFGLYVHWPFCEAKCPYCDFNSYVSLRIDQDEWCAAYLQELARAAEQTGKRKLDSVYFGGGTPSLMAPETVAEILQKASDYWTFSNDIEITLEANPGSVEASRFHAYRDSGVNRVSLGLQALNDTALHALGRLHSASEGRAALEIAQSNFDRVSFDLICARQHQTLESWTRELTDALNLGADHMSLYQLTIEPGTAFGDRYRKGKLPGLPDDDLGADMYFATQEICEAFGLPAYEVSNHARPGQESRHNMIYWQYGDYVGIGPGAHGRITLDGQKHATETFLQPVEWLKAVKASGGTSLFQPVTRRAQCEEYLMMSLRTTKGTDVRRFQEIGGYALNPDRIQSLSDIGLLTQTDSTLTASRQGRPVLNALLAELLAD